ncbi:nitroreductase family deazaflavin-dependent oxidoreductase [Tengunoibacter tsumagoiensis]|uniref:Nitroreductase n=1 Tax=Tengunoibacter tsumagoiensis TaxID=2014871 RepID=A0A402A9E0_9CHLR|nr:nitroreductase family deazaflavin-dependent oxidoreductase [Tengunoibacter tsumagoiensis]GCE15575.1 hypothetical protein KTT_54340 [Tengunoibacter tsumagoiensis]
MTEVQEVHEWNRQIIEKFRATGGNVGGQFANMPLLLLTTAGAKSGQQRTHPLAYLSEGDRIYVFAGNGGAPTNPAWYHNLLAHPEVTVEVGAEKFTARAIVVTDTEAERLLDVQVQKRPELADLRTKITRKIPAILLERKE